MSLHSHSLNIISNLQHHAVWLCWFILRVHINIGEASAVLFFSCTLSHWISDHHEAPRSQTWGENGSKSVLIELLITGSAWMISPAANMIWATVPIDVGPPKCMNLRACMNTYPPEASSPPPERIRQLQQSSNSGFLTGLDFSGSGGGFDMFRWKCQRQLTRTGLCCL